MQELFDFIERLPRPSIDKLYSESATCLGILRCLPEISKSVLMRLVVNGPTCSLETLETWMSDENQANFSSSIETLQRLHLISFQSANISVHSGYRVYLLQALSCSGSTLGFGQYSESEDKNTVDDTFLDKYSSDAWEAVLHYLVGTPSDKKPGAVMKLLEKSGLMTRQSDDNLIITSKGFQFLLQDTKVQVWSFLLQYIEISSELGMNPIEVMQFLFQLSCLKLGEDYSVSALTITQQHMLEDLKNLGLVYQRKKKSSRFYPTRIATMLTSNQMTSTQKSDEPGFIIIETNYRVYAYTTSPLQIAVLSLFVDLKSRFPNMVVGMITRDRVRDALETGISASQIITYLETHAHPEMKNIGIPSTVTDQLKIWDKERNRIRATSASLYQQFARHEDFLDILNYARDLGCLLWSSEKKRMLSVTASGHEQLREYVKRKIAKMV